MKEDNGQKVYTKVVDNYKKEYWEAEKNRRGIFWLNPVFSDAYNGRYKTIVNGKTYTICFIGISGYTPEKFEITDEKGKTWTVPYNKY